MILRASSVLAGLGLVMMGLGAIMRWYDPVLLAGFFTFSMPLMHSAIARPPLIYWGLSYGVVILLGFALAWIGWEMKRPAPVWWSAVILFLVGLNCPLQIGFSQPSWLEQFLSAGRENLSLMAFANSTNFPVIIVAPPIPAARLIDVDTLGIDGLYDRWFASVAALQVGWWFFIEGAILFLAAAGMWLPDAVTRKKQMKRAAVIFGVFLSYHLLLPVTGELCWKIGQEAECAGNHVAAKRLYYLAIALDEWNRLVPRVYSRLGALAEAENRVNSPEYHFYLGKRNFKLELYPEALDEFAQAARTDNPNWQRLAWKQYALTASTVALPLYSHRVLPEVVPVKLDMVSPGAGLAGVYWEKAAQSTDINISENFMSARGYEDSGQDQKAGKLLGLAQNGANDPLILSQILCSQGDVDYLAGDLSGARKHYLAAYALLEHNKDYWSARVTKDLTDNSLFR